MTANLDIAISRTVTPDISAQCRAVTLDLRPIIDVGPIPGGCEPTLVGPVAELRAPFVRATLQLPDLDNCTEDELADLAANAYDHESDLDVLTRSSPHVRAILGLFGRMEMRADQVATLRNNVRILSDQLATAQDIGAAFKAKVDELTTLLTAERHRVTREVKAHHQSIEMLTAAVLNEFRQRNRAERIEEQLNEERILRVAALSDLEDMRQVAIKRGEEIEAMLRPSKEGGE